MSAEELRVDLVPGANVVDPKRREEPAHEYYAALRVFAVVVAVETIRIEEGNRVSHGMPPLVGGFWVHVAISGSELR